VSVAIVLKDRLKIKIFLKIYRVIQWEKVVSWHARLLDIVGKNVFYEGVSNSEYLSN